jgi:hypothetical protein
MLEKPKKVLKESKVDTFPKIYSIILQLLIAFRGLQSAKARAQSKVGPPIKHHERPDLHRKVVWRGWPPSYDFTLFLGLTPKATYSAKCVAL